MVRLYFLALVFAATLTAAQEKCQRDKDCPGFDYCRDKVCVEPLRAGESCNRDEQCLSRDCESDGKCNSIRRLVVGAIVAIAIGCVVAVLLCCLLVYCCCCRKKRPRASNAPRPVRT